MVASGCLILCLWIILDSFFGIKIGKMLIEISAVFQYFISFQQKLKKMKKLTFITSMLLIVFVISSCSSSKQARTYEKSVAGNWQLQTITTEGITGKIKVQVLSEADFNCFIGSTWRFDKNNSLGSYEISKNGGECVAIKRNIRWSIFEEAGVPKMLQYKRVDAKYKDMDAGQAGFRFTILNLNGTNMQLKSDVLFEGKTASLIYNFIKI